MRSCILFLCVLALISTGCTGVTRTVTPEVGSIKSTDARNCGKAIVSKSAKAPELGIHEEMLKEFVGELEMSNMFNEVYYPARRSDKAEYTIEVEFGEQDNTNPLKLMLNSVLIGASLFTLEPFITYDVERVYTGKIDLYRNGILAKSEKSSAKSLYSAKLLSLDTVDSQENKEHLSNTKKSLYKQMVLNINEYCIGNK